MNDVDQRVDGKMNLEIVQKLYGHVSDVSCCDFSANKLVTCSTDKSIRIWDIQNELEYAESLHSPLVGHKYGILSCCFSPFGTLLATSSIDGTIVLWNVQTGCQEAVLRHPSGQSVRACRFSPNSIYLATGSEDYLIAIWDVQSKTLLRTLPAHEDIVTCVAFTPDSFYLASGSSDCTVELWSVQSTCFKNVFCLKDVHDLGVVSCDFSSNIKLNEDNATCEYLLATCGNDDFVKVWRTSNEPKHEITLLHQLEGHTANVMCCRFSPNGFLLASVSGDKSVIIWDPKCGQLIQKKEEHSRYITSCAFSGNSELLVTGSNDRTIIVWKVCDDADGTNTDQINCIIGNTQVGIQHNYKEYVQLPQLSEAASSTINTNTPNLSDGCNKRQLVKWSVAEVCDWLRSLDLQAYVQNFLDNAIDGQELLYLTHHSLETKLGVVAYGHRNRILRGITLLKNPSAAAYMQVDAEDSSIPEEYLCPITQQLIKDPVIAADGHSYERSAISEWLMSGKSTSPMTNEKLTHQILTPNHLLKSLIKRYP